MRFFGLAIVLTALSACAAQTPHASRSGGTPFLAIGPAGYCQSDESDRLGTELRHSRAIEAQGDQVLAVFQPCGERTPQPSDGGWSLTRVVFSVDPSPPRSGGQVMDREMYVTFLSNPKLIELLNRRLLPQFREVLAKSPQGVTASDIRYLGSDDIAVYYGLTISQDSLGPMAPRGLKGATRTVSGQTMVAGMAVKVTATNLTAGRLPEDWAVLQQTVTQAIRNTIVSAEKGMPVAPVRQLPKPAGSGLSA